METWTSNSSSMYTLLSVQGNWSNLSSHDLLCPGYHNPVMAVFDILMVVVNMPLTIYVIVASLRSPSNSGNSFSMSVLFFLHLCCLHLLFYVGILLTIVRNLGGVTRITWEHIVAFYSASLTGGSFLFSAMSIDLYVAVVHPIAYVAHRASTKRTIAYIYCTLIWAYSITLGTVVYIFKMSMYHPFPLASFYVTVPVCIFCCILVFFTLRAARPGKNGQSAKLDKTKQNAARYILNSMIILSLYNLPHMCLLIYTAVKKVEWESLPCRVLPLLLIIQISDFIAPMIFYYNTGKLTAVVANCLNVFRRGIGVC